MASKDLRPKQRLGRSHPTRVKIITWILGLAVGGGGLYAAYRYTGTTEVEVAVARVRRADFIISVRTRGTVQSAHSFILTAPHVPGLRIVHLADNGRPVKKGDVVVEFDAIQQEQNVIARTTAVRCRRRRHRATQGHPGDEQRSGRHEQDAGRVRRGERPAGRQQGRGALGGGWRQEPHSGGRHGRFVAAGQVHYECA